MNFSRGTFAAPRVVRLNQEDAEMKKQLPLALAVSVTWVMPLSALAQCVDGETRTLAIAGSENATSFALVDFTQPGSPTVTLLDPGFGAGSRVALDASSAVAGNVLGGDVRLVDVCTPSGPQLRGTLDTGLDGIGAIAISGTRVAVGEAVGSGSRVALVDFSSPDSPVLVSSTDTQQAGFGSLAFIGNDIVAGSGPNDFPGVTIDFSDPSNPAISYFSTGFLGSPALDADADANRIALGDSGGGTVKLLDATTLAVVGTVNTPLDGITSVSESGSLVLAASANDSQVVRVDFDTLAQSRFDPGLGGGSTTAIDGDFGAFGAILGSTVKLFNVSPVDPLLTATADSTLPSISTLSIKRAVPYLQNNRLTNGSFESPAIRGDVYSTDPNFLPGWTLSAGPNQFFIEHGLPFDRYYHGAQSICLNSDGAPNVWIMQTFSTDVGQRYVLRFALADEFVGFGGPPGSGPPSPTEVRVDVGPASQNFNRLSDTGWVVKELHFIANSTSTTLQIMDVTSGAFPFNSPLIDAVSVTSE